MPSASSWKKRRSGKGPRMPNTSSSSWTPSPRESRSASTTSSARTRRGYQPVVTPHIASIKLYEKSGHILTFREKMFPFMVDEEKETFILKPMNCPFHIEIYQSQMRSYRDLPIRYAEFGTVYR